MKNYTYQDMFRAFEEWRSMDRDENMDTTAVQRAWQRYVEIRDSLGGLMIVEENSQGMARMH